MGNKKRGKDSEPTQPEPASHRDLPMASDSDAPEVSDETRTDSLTGSISVTQQALFCGPLPPPSLLKGYDDVVPGAAERIITQAEMQTKHRIDMENKVVSGDSTRSFLGLAAGFVVAMTCIVGGCLLVYTGHDSAGGTIATVTVASLVGVFVYGTRERRREREGKSQMMEKSFPQPRNDEN